MKEPSNFEEITEYLLSLIPKEEIYKRKDVIVKLKHKGLL